MTHAAPMADADGVFGDWQPSAEKPRCDCPAPQLHERVWDSRCGGWTDYQYRCMVCHHSFWIEGIDS